MITFNLRDMGMAYRKAKVDLYYSSHPRLNDIATYEEDLHARLTALLEKINGEDETWVTKKDFIGSWTLAAKSIDMEGWKKKKRKTGMA